MSWYRNLLNLRRRGHSWSVTQRRQFEQKLGFALRLPDSWFALTLTLALALTTWWLQQFVAQLPLWQQISQRQIALTMNDVTILSYREGQMEASTRAISLTLASRQAPQTPTQNPDNTFEHWQMEHWQSWQRRREHVYFIRAPHALLTHETQIINLSGGVEALGFKPWAQNSLLQTINPHATREAMSPLAYLSLSTPSASYHQANSLLLLPEDVQLTLDQNTLHGDNMVVNLQTSQLTMNHIAGEFLP